MLLNDDIHAMFDNAKEYEPIPAGVYTAHITRAGRRTCKSGTQSYQIEFTICEGPYDGGRVWLDCFLTERAMARSKRSLVKLGITTAAQLDQPISDRTRCRVQVVVVTLDDGSQKNEVKDFVVVGIDEPKSFEVVDDDKLFG